MEGIDILPLKLKTPHPAKWSAEDLAAIASLRLRGGGLDPFAGVGTIHTLGLDTLGVEIEPEWASQHPRNIVADATKLPFADGTFDFIVVSPCFGNRMSDHHNARDESKRHTYRHYIGRSLHPNNTGQMQWTQPAYRVLHLQAWREAVRVLRGSFPGYGPGTFVLNISDHIRRGEVQPVTAWHVKVLTDLGLEVVLRRPIETRRQRHGENGEVRVGYESLIVFNKYE